MNFPFICYVNVNVNILHIKHCSDLISSVIVSYAFKEHSLQVKQNLCRKIDNWIDKCIFIKILTNSLRNLLGISYFNRICFIFSISNNKIINLFQSFLS